MTEVMRTERSLVDHLHAHPNINHGVKQNYVERSVVFVYVEKTSDEIRPGDVTISKGIQVAREIVDQAVSAHSGRVIKSLGDNGLLLFCSSQDAVLSAIRIQRDLEDAQRILRDRVHLRLGIDTIIQLEGRDGVDEHVVNAICRLTNRCQNDGILLSQSTFENVGPYFQSRCSPIPDRSLRGIPELAASYQLDWSPGHCPVRGVPKKEKTTIEVLWNGTESRMTICDASDRAPTVQSYEAHTLDLGQIEKLSTGISESIRQANLDGAIGHASNELAKRGKLLFNLLFPEEMRKKIRQLKSEFLILHLDDACVHIPWELAHDGHDFLCCRFSLGRMVRTSQPICHERRSLPTETLSLLVLSDPSGNLPSAVQEGKELYDLCRHDPRVDLTWLNGKITIEEVESKLPHYDIVHYCGHAEHDSRNPDESGWLLSDGHLAAGSFQGYTGKGQVFPLLVFNSACHSGETTAWDQRTSAWSYGFANAFLLAGCVHYVGAICELLDTGSKEFSRVFYRSIIAGYPVGRSLRQARLDFRAGAATQSLTWAQYVLYGDPEAGLFAELSPSRETTLQSDGPPADDVNENPSTLSETASVYPEGSVRSVPRPAAVRLISRYGLAFKSLIAAGFLISLVWYSPKCFRGATYYSELGDRYEREGNLQAALVAYNQALDMNPKDSFIKGRRDGLQSQNYLQTKAEATARQNEQNNDIYSSLDYIDAIAASPPPSTTSDDRWTSSPLCINLHLSNHLAVDATSPGGVNLASLISQLQLQIKEEGWTVVLDRSDLLGTLREIRIGLSDVADPLNSTRPGHVKPARIEATVEEILRQGKPSFEIYLSDNEEASVGSIIRSDLSGSFDILVKELARGITDSLMKDYPLQGKIIQIDSSGILLNIGQDVRVINGDVFVVYPKPHDPIFDDNITFQEVVTKITVEAVGERVSRCALPSGEHHLEVGMRVRVERP